MLAQLDKEALDLIFVEARTHSKWKDKSVDTSLLHQAHDIARFGATSANCCPLRITFVLSQKAKQKLKPHLDPGNLEKTMSAPVVAIFAHDTRFHELLPKLYPHADAKSWFEGNDALIQETAFRNGTLQAAYFMLACRALGLDCGPMSGFSQEGVNQTFFPDGRFKSNFLCNIGYGEADALHSRSPRFEFDEVCEVL